MNTRGTSNTDAPLALNQEGTESETEIVLVYSENYSISLKTSSIKILSQCFNFAKTMRNSYQNDQYLLFLLYGIFVNGKY